MAIDFTDILMTYHFPERPWTNLSLEAIFQDPKELASLSSWINMLGVMKYLEIGVAAGGLMHFLTNALGLTGYGIDVMKPLMVPEDWVCVGDCHAEKTIDWAQRNAPYDMVFIDADHSYEAVKKDWDTYGCMATKIVVFHDIAHSTLSGPRKVWDSIKEKKLEIISSGQNLGIGIVFLEE